MCNSVVYTTVTGMCSHHYNVEQFYHLKKKPSKKPWTVTPHPPSYCHPQLQPTTNLLSVPINPPFSRSSYDWNTARGLLWLASSTYHVFKVHPYCGMCKYFIPFRGQITLWCMLYYILFTYPSINGHSICFCLLAINNNAAINICVQVSVLTLCFDMTVLRYIPRTGTAGSHG